MTSSLINTELTACGDIAKCKYNSSLGIDGLSRGAVMR